LTSNTQFVKDSVQIYVNQLIPKIKTIADLMYDNRYVDYNESTNTYHLINNKHSIAQLEYDIVPTKKRESSTSKQVSAFLLKANKKYPILVKKK
jgi:hypothetical protein